MADGTPRWDVVLNPLGVPSRYEHRPGVGSASWLGSQRLGQEDWQNAGNRNQDC
ncbi:MAG: hypothetical protein WDM70_06845 [Nitrosomonadales bacterium]